MENDDLKANFEWKMMMMLKLNMQNQLSHNNDAIILDSRKLKGKKFLA